MTGGIYEGQEENFNSYQGLCKGIGSTQEEDRGPGEHLPD